MKKYDISDKYYEKVAAHFDQDARLFEERYNENPVLQKIRSEFRKYTEEHGFEKALEIGSGPGMDLVYFAEKYPQKNFYGIDVSPEMARIANANLKAKGLNNAIAKTGSVEDLTALFPGEKFDMIYIYFGGLNTVFDLKKVVKKLHEVSAPGAAMVFTCVNRYYLMDFFFKSLKLKFGQATSRFRNRWKGYSPGRDLPSRVYSSSFVKMSFQPEFEIIYKRGYSIFFPPWFGARHLKKIKRLGNMLWETDRLLQNTPMWNAGEYSLYVMKRN